MVAELSRGVRALSRTTGFALSRAARVAGLTNRGVWSAPDRHHIEVRGVAAAGSVRLANEVEMALGRLPGVEWARVNAPSGRVVVSVGPGGPRLPELLRVVAEVERRAGPEEPCAPPHPPEEGPRTGKALSTIAADTLGLGLSAATRILPFTPVPGEVAGLLNAIDLHPRLRALAGRGLRGDHRAESVLPLAEAVVQGLTGGWAGILLDGAQRVLQWGEARAQCAAWERSEPHLTGAPELAAAPPPPDERPRAKPDGPVESFCGKFLSAGAAAGSGILPLVGAKRAAALTLAALPKAPSAGREAYAARLGRLLAQRGVLAMDRGVLRELDRIDTLLLDDRVLRSERGVLTDLVPLADADPEQVAVRAYELFDPDRPGAIRRGDGWLLAPLADLPPAGAAAQREAQRLGAGADSGASDGSDGSDGSDSDNSDGNGIVLGLASGETLAALVRVEPEAAPGVAALPAAARRAGIRVVVAGPTADRYDFAEARRPGGPELATTVRELQHAGAMVMLVSGDRRALGAADCGLGVWHPGDLPPWGAHLLVGDDLAVPALIVEAAGVARELARRHMLLAAAGSGLGAIAAFTSPRSRLPGRTVAAVNAAAGIALAHSVWRARQLSGRAPDRAAPRTPWHLMPVSTVLARLGTSPDGLSSAEVDRRRRPETGDRGVAVGPGRAFLAELDNPLTPVLAAGAGVSAAVGSLVDAALVGGVVGVSALVGAVHRVRTDRSLATLLAGSAVTARVRRDGRDREVAADELVPGDVLTIGVGDSVPADCRLVEATGLEVDESSLTGESLPVAKDPAPVVAAEIAERRSMLYEGSTIAAGRGLAVVVATGAETEVGRGMALAREAQPDGGVAARLSGLTRAAIPLAAGSALAVAGAGWLRRVPLAETAATAANLAVASVPEGLPFLVSAAQLAAARRLAGRGALVRNPRTIEALGRVDVLCFDKTGTLTEGEVRLAGVGDGERYAPVRAGARAAADDADADTDDGADAGAAVNGAATDAGNAADAGAGLDARLRSVLVAALRATSESAESGRPAQQTDQAILAGARRAGVGVAADGKGTPDGGWRPVAALPFEPSRGYHATAGRTADGTMLLSVKGAPETILDCCASRRTAGGDRTLDEAGRRELHQALAERAGAGQRLLAVAERRLPDPDRPVSESDVAELTFLGFVALSDVVRDSAAPAVRRIREAGVHTIMITGDHPGTAEAIATTIDGGGGSGGSGGSEGDGCGSGGSGAAAAGQQRVTTGSELDELDDDALAERLARIDVVARCTPAHKVRIIKALRRCGRTVAMTGDGANDAPAIRLADVGIALGRRGTPAARAAADLVVTDDRLETIIDTLIEGRAMWSSVRHALSVLVGGNLGEIAFSVLSAAVTGRSALTGRQLLLVNLLTDLAPAMAIAVRPPHPRAAEDLIAEGPDASLGATLTREIALRATTTTLGATTGWTVARFTGRRRRAGTVALAALVGTQLGQTLLDGGRSPAVLAATAGSVAVLVGAIQTPGVSHFFGCTPLGPVGWGIAAGSAVGATVANRVLDRLPAPAPGGPGGAASTANLAGSGLSTAPHAGPAGSPPDQ